jgi:proline racemase
MLNHNHFPSNASDNVPADAASGANQKPVCTVCLEASPIEPQEPTQRLTIEIPRSLHVKIKTVCARRRTKMKDDLQAVLEAHY